MEVAIGSKNIPKQRAVAAAFRQVYPDDFLEFHTLAVDSEVSSHPTSAQESLEGALNRLKNAKAAQPEADFYVGIEGGLLRVEDRAWEHSWVAVEDKKGQLYTAISAGLEMRGKLLQAILNGQELGKAFAEQHGTENVGNKMGAYGHVTNNLVTRESATTDAVIFALAGFIHPEYFR